MLCFGGCLTPIQHHMLYYRWLTETLLGIDSKKVLGGNGSLIDSHNPGGTGIKIRAYYGYSAQRVLIPNSLYASGFGFSLHNSSGYGSSGYIDAFNSHIAGVTRASVNDKIYVETDYYYILFLLS